MPLPPASGKLGVKSIQAPAPESAVVVQPARQFVKRPWVKGVDAPLSVRPHADQPRLPKHPQVPGDGRPTDRKR